MKQKQTDITLHDSDIARQLDHKRVALVTLDRPDYFSKKGYFIMFQDYIERLSHAGLTGREWSVLTQLLTRLDFQNNIVIKQTDIAHELGLNQANVSRAFKRLIEIGCVEKNPSAGINAYRLSADFVWRGKGKNYSSSRTKQMRETTAIKENEEVLAHAKRAIKRIKNGIEFSAAIEDPGYYLGCDDRCAIEVETVKLMEKLGMKYVNTTNAPFDL